MEAIVVTGGFAFFIALTFAAWRRYLWAAQDEFQADTCPYSLTDVFGDRPYVNVPHQKGVRWLTEVFSRSAKKFPHKTALQIPHTGESLTYAELDARAENIAAALSPYLTGPDQVVAVAMSQDNWQIVASHLGVLKAGGTLMFLDTTLPEALITHMLKDAAPVVILTRGEGNFRDRPTLDVMTVPETISGREPPTWLDDPKQRLATIFYTSGTTGMPKGVECPHAGYVNLALSYADYFDLIPGMDATSLTSSLGYDGSISEMYDAWVSGSAVVMLTKEQVRSGPDLVPILCEAEVTVLFCPPVLLTTLTTNPEVDLPYPLCRYIVPAGEAFPQALVEPWTRCRRQIINTYGPTEASTDTSRQSLRPSEPITIGSPIPNVTYVILDVEGLRPLPHGEIGELCIGGIHVARGYRNLPDQTAEKFITHPQFGRLYRTGDRCRIDGRTQRVHFLGRIDAQLKVRGHRVEAQAVEDILQTQFTDIEAAVLDYQNDELIAFISAPAVCQRAIPVAAAAPAEWAARVTATLAMQLPEASVPSRIFLVERFAMKPVSGKIDRKALPNLSDLLESVDSGARITGRGAGLGELKTRDVAMELGPECEEALAICREVFETPLGPDDEFADAGGHSIAIARLARRLQAAGWSVTVRGLLSDCNTVRKVTNRPRAAEHRSEAPRPDAKNDKRSAERDEAAAEVLSVAHFTTLQVLFRILLYSPGLLAFVGVFAFADVGTFFITATLMEFIIVSFGLFLLMFVMPLGSLLWVMLIKLFMGGHIYKNNVTPGAYPKWSKMHLRIWCIGQLEHTVLRQLGRSAPFMPFALRQLGATVGDDLQCAHDATISGPLDLISIEDNVAIQTGAYIQTSRWSGQFLHVGPVHLESGCKIGMGAAIANNVSVGRGTWITPVTPILSDVGPHEMWEGAPARLSGRCTELKRTANACKDVYPAWFSNSVNILMQIFISFWLNVVPTAAILCFARALIPTGGAELTGAYFSVTPVPEMVWHLTIYAFMTTWVTVVVTSLLSCLFIRWTAAVPGLYPSRGFSGALLLYRVNLMNSIQGQWTWTITGQYMRALAGMRFPRLGASECDLMFNLVPELATAGSQVFWSYGGFTNMLDCGAEHYKLRQLDMPRNFFSGSNSVAEYGQFPANFLLGVSTPASDLTFRRQMRSRPGEPITVAGNPPVKFASTSFGVETETQRLPGFPIFLSRVFLCDLFSIGILRNIEVFFFAILYVLLLRLAGPQAGAIMALVLTEVSLVLFAIAIKTFLVGSRWGTDHSTPFWSWKHFAYFFAQDCFDVGCKATLGFCAGTILSNPILRWMGCKIGRRTIVIQPSQCSDWNAVNFGSDCVIDGFLQFHTFENRVLKVKRTHIGDGCTVSFGATVMGGVVMERDTTLLPLSLVLKEMNLHTATYEGSPAEPASGSTSSPQVATESSASKPYVLDNTDWLKTAAIMLVFVDHFGYFFMEDDLWWSVIGRLAAPTFFFLIGYARTRTIPLHWIGLGIFLTLLDSWNTDWAWVAPNILLSFALIRIASRFVEPLIQKFGWLAFAILATVLFASLPLTGEIVDYGAEGWLWALFGFCQLRYVQGKSATDADRAAQRSNKYAGLMRLVACFIAAGAYIWQEQIEFSFPKIPFTVFIVGVALLSISLCMFRRTPSRFQPPQVITSLMGFAGRHTLEIYAIQLAASEIIIKLLPSLAG